MFVAFFRCESRFLSMDTAIFRYPFAVVFVAIGLPVSPCGSRPTGQTSPTRPCNQPIRARSTSRLRFQINACLLRLSSDSGNCGVGNRRFLGSTDHQEISPQLLVNTFGGAIDLVDGSLMVLDGLGERGSPFSERGSPLR